MVVDLKRAKDVYYAFYYAIKINWNELVKLGRSLVWVVFVVFALYGGLLILFAVVVSYTNLFPAQIETGNAANLLSAIVQIDGILLGFFSLIIASFLNDIQSEIASVRQGMKQHNTRSHAEGESYITQLRVTRGKILLLTIMTTLSFAISILWTLSRLGQTASLPRGDLYYSFVFLFGGLLLILSVLSIGTGPTSRSDKKQQDRMLS